MMKKIVSITVLLALCVPALAVDMPNMIGNWTGTAHAVEWLKNSNYATTGKTGYWDVPYTIAITEQNGTRFAGRMFRDANPLKSEVILGVIGSDNKTVAMVDENDYYWCSMKSPTEMELIGPSIGMTYMDMAIATFTKNNNETNVTKTK